MFNPDQANNQPSLGSYIQELVAENTRMRKQELHPAGETFYPEEESAIVSEEWSKIANAVQQLEKVYSRPNEDYRELVLV